MADPSAVVDRIVDGALVLGIVLVVAAAGAILWTTGVRRRRAVYALCVGLVLSLGVLTYYFWLAMSVGA